MITADQYSGYPSIFECGKTASTKQVTDHLVQLFSTFSVPVTIYSDGGPQFFSGEGRVDQFLFTKFCKEWGVEHVVSSPHYPQSNGIAEGAVREMKKLIIANWDDNSNKCKVADLAASLLLFRNTPRLPTNLAPNKIVFGRLVWDNLPISRALFKPDVRFEVEKRLQQLREEKERKRSAEATQPRRELPLLHPGQRVRVQHPATKRWTITGSIVRFGQNEREYFYKDDRNDRVYRRNRRFIKPIDVEAQPPPKQPFQAPPLTLPAQPKGNPEVAQQVPGNNPIGDMEPKEGPKSVLTASRPTRVIRRPVRFRD